MFVLATFMSYVTNLAVRREEERGATAVEYGLLVALIAAIIVAAVALLGQNILDGFNDVNEQIPATTSDTE